MNWIDYGARFYDAQLGRWRAIDPMAEKYLPFSPYVYVLNNPLILTTPNGMDVLYRAEAQSAFTQLQLLKEKFYLKEKF